MPPAYVKTVREEILYEYAKLIPRSAHGSIQYGFVTDRFNPAVALLYPIRYNIGNEK
jgi:hypothetical protein